MSYEWSRVVSAEGKEEYMTIQCRLHTWVQNHKTLLKGWQEAPYMAN